MVWSIVSNAADRSNRISRVTFWLSMATRMSFCTRSRAVSVLVGTGSSPDDFEAAQQTRVFNSVEILHLNLGTEDVLKSIFFWVMHLSKTQAEVRKGEEESIYNHQVCGAPSQSPLWCTRARGSWSGDSWRRRALSCCRRSGGSRDADDRRCHTHPPSLHQQSAGSV